MFVNYLYKHFPVFNESFDTDIIAMCMLWFIVIIIDLYNHTYREKKTRLIFFAQVYRFEFYLLHSIN